MIARMCAAEAWSGRIFARGAPITARLTIGGRARRAVIDTGFGSDGRTLILALLAEQHSQDGQVQQGGAGSGAGSQRRHRDVLSAQALLGAGGISSTPAEPG